ncbi:MAG TPA: serine hydrolase [Thermoanaerobaculia bacterium]|nr:serine hydrolase [Thermoanaerobaculia bacterium]
MITALVFAVTLDAFLPSADINGGVLVADRGAVVYEHASGFADFARRVPNTIDTPFQTASITKTLTSTAILQLRDRGKLELDKPVRRYLPDFPFEAITLRHLLSHTSALPDLELFESVVQNDPARVISNADVIPALRAWQRPLEFKPGDRFRYSNTNYMLLALVIERVSGQTYSGYLERYLFRPAGMRDSFVGDAAHEKKLTRAAKNHLLPTMYTTEPVDVATLDLRDERKMRRIRYETRNLGATVGDQNVFSTLRDLYRFDQALRSGRLLSRRSLDEAATPVKLNDGSTYFDAEVTVAYGLRCSYGLGWEVCDDPAVGKLMSHSGYNRGIATVFYRNLSKNQTVIAFDNTDGNSLAQKVASAVNILNGKEPLEIDSRASLTREFGATLVARGAAAAIIRLNEMRAQSDEYVGTPRGMNVLGYDLLHNGHTALALEPFRINLILHPDDANVYDSYGDALAGNGDAAGALAMYRKAVMLDPNNMESRRKLQELETAARK